MKIEFRLFFIIASRIEQIMDSLPAELIDAIGSFLDFHSAARFSFTCRIAYGLARPYVSSMVATRKLTCDKIRAIKHEICERGEQVRGDIYGDYCSVRTYPCGHIVGTLHATAYNQKTSTSFENTIFFSSDIRRSTGKFGSHDEYLDDEDCQIYVDYYLETHGEKIDRASVICTGYQTLYWVDRRDAKMRCYVSIHERSPTISGGNLQWYEQIATKDLLDLI